MWPRRRAEQYLPPNRRSAWELPDRTPRQPRAMRALGHQRHNLFHEDYEDSDHETFQRPSNGGQTIDLLILSSVRSLNNLLLEQPEEPALTAGMRVLCQVLNAPLPDYRWLAMASSSCSDKARSAVKLMLQEITNGLTADSDSDSDYTSEEIISELSITDDESSMSSAVSTLSSDSSDTPNTTIINNAYTSLCTRGPTKRSIILRTKRIRQPSAARRHLRPAHRMPSPSMIATQVANRVIKYARSVRNLYEHQMCCLSCGFFPVNPVTGSCGHTRCFECIVTAKTCPCGDAEPEDIGSLFVNITIRDLIGKTVSEERLPSVKSALTKGATTNENPAGEMAVDINVPTINEHPGGEMAVDINVATMNEHPAGEMAVDINVATMNEHPAGEMAVDINVATMNEHPAGEMAVDINVPTINEDSADEMAVDINVPTINLNPAGEMAVDINVPTINEDSADEMAVDINVPAINENLAGEMAVDINVPNETIPSTSCGSSASRSAASRSSASRSAASVSAVSVSAASGSSASGSSASAIRHPRLLRTYNLTSYSAHRWRIPMSPRARYNQALELLLLGQHFEAAPLLALAAASQQPDLGRARLLLAQCIQAINKGRNLRHLTRQLYHQVRERSRLSWVKPADLECILCLDTFTNPVTTPCGHMFCRTCIERSMDYRKRCPLCLREFSDFNLLLTRDTVLVTAALSSIHVVKKIVPLEPDVIPIFVCTVAFPTMPCPLFIFDPRHWLMIRRVLESSTRNFGMVASDRNQTYSDYGTVLEVRDCVHLEDGRSILSTVGVSRFRVIERCVRDGCEFARILPIVDTGPADYMELMDFKTLASQILFKAMSWIKRLNKRVKADIIEAFGDLDPPFDNSMEVWYSADGPAWLWWVVAVLPLRTEIKVLILSTDCILKRMLAVSRTLKAVDQVTMSTPTDAECELRHTLPPEIEPPPSSSGGGAHVSFNVCPSSSREPAE